MRPYEFMRIYHPKLGMFVHQHKGSGIIVDNIFKPIRRILSPVVKKFAKQSGKKALKSGVSYVSKQADKKTSEKSGDLIMEKLRNMRTYTPPIEQQQESTDAIINRLISGSGVKRRRRLKFM